MINPTNIQPGETVYVCRRGLTGRYTGLMTIEKVEVVKRTKLGYKTKTIGDERSYIFQRLDADYYISANHSDVCEALLIDAGNAETETEIRLSKIRSTIARLNDELYGA